MATLDRDLLFEIAEKLVVKTFFLSKPTDLAAVKFMLVNRDCKRAFLSQFSLLNIVSLHKSPCCYSYFNEDLTEYYENDDKLWLIKLLIQSGKFKPKDLTLEGYFSDISALSKHVSRRGQFSSMECFSHLVGLNKAGLNLRRYEGPELLLDHLGVNEDKACFVELDTLLRFNAKEIVLFLKSEDYVEPNISGFSPVNSTRVEKFAIVYQYDYWRSDKKGARNYSTKKWFQLLSYVMSSCPNIKDLVVFIHVKERKDNTTGVLKSLLKAVKGMKDVVLQRLPRDGCFIQVCLGSCSLNFSLAEIEELNRELLSIGVAKPVEEGEAIRRVVTFDGRAELCFGILGKS
uniref:Uncharacterized protein n=1 Tax=Ditylenchus dipsaci TaxID=166011 RepID=A0A915E2U8_9BILA